MGGGSAAIKGPRLATPTITPGDGVIENTAGVLNQGVNVNSLAVATFSAHRSEFRARTVHVYFLRVSTRKLKSETKDK